MSGKKSKKKRSRTPARDQKSNTHLWWLLFICLITFTAYAPVLQNDFTNWDDPVYVVDNPVIRSVNWANIKHIFSSFVLSNYHPVTMVSYMLDHQIGGLGPGQYHLTNLLVHVINTGLVFFFVLLLFRQKIPALFAALLFGIHPLHVESVAWIAERKDVLYTMFYLAALCAYLLYLKGKKRFYGIAIALFVLSLLSKAMAAPLAVTLVAVDYYQCRPLTAKKVWLEKLPFFLLALVFGIIAVWGQSTKQAFEMAGAFSILQRIALAGYGFFQYLFKLIAPVSLSAIYPYPQVEQGGLPLYYYLFPFLVAGLAAGIAWTARRSRFYVFNAVFFVVNILLVLQFVPVGNAVMADRYSYVPSIAFFVILAFGVYHLYSKWPRFKKLVLTVFFLYAGLLAVATWDRSRVWRSSQTLWQDTLSRYPRAAEAWNNLGMFQLHNQQYQKALQSFNRVIQLEPQDTRAYTNRGNIQMILGHPDSAIIDYTKALQLDSLYMEAYSNRGVAHMRLNNFAAGYKDFNRAVKLGPEVADSYYKRGMANKLMNRFDLAVKDFTQAIQLDKDFARAWLQRGIVYHNLGNDKAARKDLLKAGRLGLQEAYGYLE